MWAEGKVGRGLPGREQWLGRPPLPGLQQRLPLQTALPTQECQGAQAYCPALLSQALEQMLKRALAVVLALLAPHCRPLALQQGPIALERELQKKE